MNRKPVYATTNNERPYQGYPYVNPAITDAPSLHTNHQQRPDNVNDATGVSRVNTNHGRPDNAYLNRELGVKFKKETLHPAVYIDIPDFQNYNEDNDNEHVANPAKSTNDTSQQNPVIYVDILNVANSDEANNNDNMVNVATAVRTDERINKETNIHQGNDNASNVETIGQEANTSSREAQNHDIYITEYNNQLATRNIEEIDTITEQPGPSNMEQNYVNETIFFDPFENRRIDPNNFLANAPKRLNLTHRLPIPDDDFNLTPLPVNQFPEPPPAYSEIDTNVTPRISVPARTEVITNRPIQTGVITADRKLLTCQHCRSRVHTVVIRQAGAATHFMALLFLVFCLFPITLLIYFSKWFKYKNHYCPNCSKRIGYEVPILCQELAYV